MLGADPFDWFVCAVAAVFSAVFITTDGRNAVSADIFYEMYIVDGLIAHQAQIDWLRHFIFIKPLNSIF